MEFFEGLVVGMILMVMLAFGFAIYLVSLGED